MRREVRPGREANEIPARLKPVPLYSMVANVSLDLDPLLYDAAMNLLDCLGALTRSYSWTD
jgi:hypothetical protein